jgi:hypothetical protein
VVLSVSKVHNCLFLQGFEVPEEYHILHETPTFENEEETFF